MSPDLLVERLAALLILSASAAGLEDPSTEVNDDYRAFARALLSYLLTA